MFKWHKKGKIFDPSNRMDWMKSQAQNPYVIERDRYIRVYFNCRGEKNKEGKNISYPGFVDLDKNDFFNILKISDKPILQLGSKGSFDEFGVMAGSVYHMGDEIYLYYCGWTRMISVPYNWAIGLAKSSDGGVTFSRIGNGPIIGPTYKEPYLQAGCSAIIKIKSLFHLWYTSGIKWIDTGSKLESVYRIMHATSDDGINWKREGQPIIESILEDEAQASPSVININDKWHMVFCYRYSVNFRNKERGYRLGYAWSTDLKVWHRDDLSLGFEISNSGWDSEMVCYPHICKIDDIIYLFYCGNNFGHDGFGYAMLK